MKDNQGGLKAFLICLSIIYGTIAIMSYIAFWHIIDIKQFHKENVKTRFYYKFYIEIITP